jgi:hypothetical protein
MANDRAWVWDSNDRTPRIPSILKFLLQFDNGTILGRE